jgi:serine/threonine-protein kinase RsbW
MTAEIVRHKILVPADTSKLCDLREEITGLCDHHDVAPKVTRRMVLAIDEALANIIEHAQLKTEDSEIELCLEVSEDKIVAEISDSGIAFDPSPCFKSPDCRLFPRRGFGLYLIHMIVDSVTYERTSEGRNVLTLTKTLA